MDLLFAQSGSLMETMEKLTVEQCSQTAIIKLSTWRSEMYEMIDQIFQLKKYEIHQFADQHRETFSEQKTQHWQDLFHLHGDVQRLIDDTDVSSRHTEELQQRLESIEETFSAFERNFLPLETNVSVEGLVTLNVRPVPISMPEPSAPLPTVHKSSSYLSRFSLKAKRADRK